MLCLRRVVQEAFDLAGAMRTTTLPGTSEHCNGCIGPFSGTGASCSAVGVGRARSCRSYSKRSRSGFHSCDQDGISLTRSCKLSPCCESASEERSAGNLHATFCGSRRAGNRPRPPGGQPAMAVPPAAIINQLCPGGMLFRSPRMFRAGALVDRGLRCLANNHRGEWV